MSWSRTVAVCIALGCCLLETQKADAQQQNQQREQDSQLLGRQPGADPTTDLSPDHAADEQEKGEEDVDRLVLHRLQERDVRGHEDLRFGRVGKHAPRGLARLLTPERLVIECRVLRCQPVG